ncbi:MAG TPA: DUF551 domain-containing protein [Verrucomicrobiae bacterium]|nr:DUF551 domain-containing protein [Verrucomicrobiae bacterium]
MTEWISVNDKLPPFQTDVLVVEDEHICIAIYWDNSNIDEKNNWSYHGGEVIPTHWMPLPELPK